MLLRFLTHGLGAAVLAATLLATPSAAQQRQAFPGPSSAGPPTARGGDVLRHFDPDLDTQNVNLVEGGGFVFGTNIYGDLAKAVCFDLPEEHSAITIEQVDIYLIRAEAPTLTAYDLVIWEGGPGFDGIADAGPQAEVTRQEFVLAEVAGRPDDLPAPAHAHVLAAPVMVEGPFCTGIQWEAAAGREDVGIVHTTPLAEESPFEWELQADSVWHNVSQSWTNRLGWHAWLEVIYTAAGTATEDGAQPQRLVLSAVHPNPAATRASVRLEADEAQRVTVEVFDVLGRRVATLFEGAVAGACAFDLDAAALRPGFYVVRVQGEGFVESRRFVVAH